MSSDSDRVRRERARLAAKAAQAVADEKRRQRRRAEQIARELRTRQLVETRRAKRKRWA